MKTTLTSATMCVLLIQSGTAYAQAASDKDIEALRQSIAAQQAQLDAQQKQLQALEAAKLSAQENARWTVSYNRPRLTTADGRSSLSVRALVQADYAHYAQDDAGALTTDFRRGSVGATSNREINGARDLSDGIYFRRARFGIEGVLNRDFSYRLMMELGGSGVEGAGKINDAWLAYTGFAPFTIQLGAFSPPANLDDSTTPDDSLFIEKAAPAELARSLGGADGRIGLGFKGSGTRWMSSLTLTGRTIADAEVFDAQNAVVARAASLIATATNYNLHLGASATYVLHAADAGVDATGARYGIRFRNQPELRVDSTRLIDTGSIDAAHAYVAGVEVAGNWRNAFLQAENFWYGIERRNSTLASPKFNGYYIETSWMITGESRRYNMATGAFQNPRPFVNASSSGGWGAWELALRYSRSDLNFHQGLEGVATPAEGIRGGTQDILTFGTNWYLNPNVKLVFNYLHINVDRLNPSTTAFGAAPASPPIGVEIGQSLNAYALRMQYSL